MVEPKKKRRHAKKLGFSALLSVVAALCYVTQRPEAGAILRALSDSIAGVSSSDRK